MPGSLTIPPTETNSRHATSSSSFHPGGNPIYDRQLFESKERKTPEYFCYASIIPVEMTTLESSLEQLLSSADLAP